MSVHPMLAVITARGGSKGLPGKNIRPLAGLPLIAHSVRGAQQIGEIDRCIVSTDDPAIAEVAASFGGDVPFLRPAALAQDDTPMIPVLRHALLAAEAADDKRYESLLLLDPTSPGRLPEDVTAAVAMLDADPQAVGVVSVSEPRFNPRWVCVEEQAGYMAMAFSPERFTRRQDVPPVYRINATLYLWRRDFLLSPAADRWQDSPHKVIIIPEERAIHIDTLPDFELAALMLSSGIVQFPWLAD